MHVGSDVGIALGIDVGRAVGADADRNITCRQSIKSYDDTQ